MTSTPAFMDERQARDEICRVGRSLFERGYVHATAGNISVRLADGYLITPTDACLGTLQPERLARLDAQGQQAAAVGARGGGRAGAQLGGTTRPPPPWPCWKSWKKPPACGCCASPAPRR